MPSAPKSRSYAGRSGTVHWVSSAAGGLDSAQNHCLSGTGCCYSHYTQRLQSYKRAWAFFPKWEYSVDGNVSSSRFVAKPFSKACRIGGPCGASRENSGSLPRNLSNLTLSRGLSFKRQAFYFLARESQGAKHCFFTFTGKKALHFVLSRLK